MKLIRTLALACIALSLTACSGGSSGSTGVLNLRVTDVPFSYDIVQSATISVDKITIVPAGEADDDHDDGNADDDQGQNGDDNLDSHDDGGDGDHENGDDHEDGDHEGGTPIVLYEGAPIVLDIFHLRDGITQQLNQSTLPAGTYRKLRLRLTDATLVLTNGNSYSVAAGTIHLSSECSSGINVFFDPPIEIVRGRTSDVLLDFDLTQTFHAVPPDDALNADYYILQPVIHATNLGHTGGITGHVTQDDGMGGLAPVEGATVYVLPPGQTDTTLAVATTATTASGSYTVLGVLPGPYDVMAVKDALSGLAPGITVTVGEVTTVDVTIH